jgi:predicted dehydrogenase
MQFSLLGDHPDGLAMARAMALTGRHVLATYSGPPAGIEFLGQAGLRPKVIRDIEEVLADPSIDAVIVGSGLNHRAAHLRRALQSERHVLCVCPADRTPDIAYEAAMIQKDTHCVLLPLLPLCMHPAIVRLGQLIRESAALGAFQLLQSELAFPSQSLGDLENHSGKLSLPGWEVLRALGGEISEVSALAVGAETEPGEPLLVSGRFDRRGVFQISYLPRLAETLARFTARGSNGWAELVFAQGFSGPAVLLFASRGGSSNNETWEPWNPWPVMVEVFEKALANGSANGDAKTPAEAADQRRESRLPEVTWQAAVRCLELDDAARRSLKRRTVIALEYQEASEEVGFKGTMTLVGCGLLWFILIVAILSRWEPRLGWVIIPVLVLFLFLQLFRWILPKSGKNH